MTLKNGFLKCLSLFYQPMDEKIKTRSLRFPAKKPEYGESIVRLANPVGV